MDILKRLVYVIHWLAFFLSIFSFIALCLDIRSTFIYLTVFEDWALLKEFFRNSKYLIEDLFTVYAMYFYLSFSTIIFSVIRWIAFNDLICLPWQKVK
jgi:hypothetical protein